MSNSVNETRIRAADAEQAVGRSDDGLYAILREEPGLELGYYRPRGEDAQTPHDRNEVYIVAAGSGRFVCGGETMPFEAGDALYVAAGVEHRFIEFSDDFAAWVVFAGRPSDSTTESD